MKSNAHISPELVVTRVQNGFKLARPHYIENQHYDSRCTSLPLSSVSDLMAMPFNVYFMDVNHQIVELNDQTWKCIGRISRKDAVGKSIEHMCANKSHAFNVISNDKNVMRMKNVQSFAEHAELINNISINALSIKAPWYDDNNDLLGIFGVAVVLNQTSIAHAASHLAVIANMMLIPPASLNRILPGRTLEKEYFTDREIDIMRLIVHGKTMREAAMILKLSRRTVENYFSHIKGKMGVATKSQFIEKALRYFV